MTRASPFRAREPEQNDGIDQGYRHLATDHAGGTSARPGELIHYLAMTLDAFLKHLRATPAAVRFDDTIELIDALYDFTPTAFRNGEQYNAAGENSGSCKILAFGQLQGLAEAETLVCFGRYYREDVLGDPDGQGHANIRNFMRHGWAGVQFDGTPLTLK